jgi:hypothetical protein
MQWASSRNAWSRRIPDLHKSTRQWSRSTTTAGSSYLSRRLYIPRHVVIVLRLLVRVRFGQRLPYISYLQSTVNFLFLVLEYSNHPVQVFTLLGPSTERIDTLHFLFLQQSESVLSRSLVRDYRFAVFYSLQRCGSPHIELEFGRYVPA